MKVLEAFVVEGSHKRHEGQVGQDLEQPGLWVVPLPMAGA